MRCSMAEASKSEHIRRGYTACRNGCILRCIEKDDRGCGAPIHVDIGAGMACCQQFRHKTNRERIPVFT